VWKLRTGELKVDDRVYAERPPPPPERDQPPAPPPQDQDEFVAARYTEAAQDAGEAAAAGVSEEEDAEQDDTAHGMLVVEAPEGAVGVEAQAQGAGESGGGVSVQGDDGMLLVGE
jgi:hypothetical protein